MPADANQPKPGPNGSGLTVRRFERHALSIPVQVSLDEETQQIIRFSRSSGADNRFQATLVDLGQGGLGLESQWYLPRKAVLRVRLLEDASKNLPGFETSVRVMRSRMSTRQPSYALGCLFLDPTPQLHQTVDDVLSAVAALERGEEAA